MEWAKKDAMFVRKYLILNEVKRVKGIEPSFPTSPGRKSDFTREKLGNAEYRWITTYSKAILGV